MLSFSCGACGIPLRLAQVGSWLSGEPFCGPACVGQVDQDELRSKTPSREEHLQAYPVLLNEIGAFVRGLIERTKTLDDGPARDRAVASLGTAAAATAALAGGALLAPVAIAAANASIDSRHQRAHAYMEDHIYELGCMMFDLVRRTMALQAEGYPPPPPVLSAIQASESLVASEPELCRQLLQTIFVDLESTFHHTKAWA